MNEPPKDETTPPLFIRGCAGGLYVGAAAGAVIGVLTLLLMALSTQSAPDAEAFGTQSAPDADFGSWSLVIYMALIIGAVKGGVAGTVFGSMLGGLLRVVRHRAVGIAIGAIAGLAVSFDLITGPAKFNLAPPEAWVLFPTWIGGGAIAGYILACMLLKYSPKDLSQSAA